MIWQGINFLDMDKEIWKDIKGFEGIYQISNTGFVKSLRTNNIRISGNNGNGYRYVPLSKHGKVKNHYIHRLVALAFIPNPLKKYTVNHSDGNKNNNHVDNLEWATQSENSQHGFDNGLIKQKKGAKNPNSKKIIQFTMDMNFIREYDYIREAEKITGIKSQNIGMACMGKYKQSGGFIWRYKK